MSAVFLVPGSAFFFSRLLATGYRLQLFVMPQLRGDIDQLGSAATNPKRRLRRRTPKAVAFRGAPPNWRMPRQRLALWSAAAQTPLWITPACQ
jgi:hypothetical protein